MVASSSVSLFADFKELRVLREVSGRKGVAAAVFSGVTYLSLSESVESVEEFEFEFSFVEEFALSVASEFSSLDVFSPTTASDCESPPLSDPSATALLSEAVSSLSAVESAESSVDSLEVRELAVSSAAISSLKEDVSLV